MTRAALLPAGADPFLNAYWLRNYRTWADEVDELHVAVCGPIPPEVIDYHHRLIQDVPHATFHYISKRTAHGRVLTFLLEQTFADHVVMLEDDAFIRRRGVIDEAFGQLESGATDLIGSPRNGYASLSLIAAATARFGDELLGLAFWPCFLFASRDDLNATDRNFDGTIWDEGTKFLDVTLTERSVADTFVWASYQLRDLGLNVTLRDGYRLEGRPIDDEAPWFHVGSLSSGHGYSWQNPNPRDRAFDVLQWGGLPPGEAAKRFAWWQRAWDHWDGGIPEYHEAYGAEMRQFQDDLGISQNEVAALRGTYDHLVTWAES